VSGTAGARELSFPVSERIGAVSALLVAPRDAWGLYVLAHGAGAGMRHAFLEQTSAVLARSGVATLRYQFPYTEAGARRPDPPAVLEETVRAAVRAAASSAPGLALFAGGKSMGGRMTSQAQAKEPLPGVRALVFLGFPLHAPRRPASSRAEHLARVRLPMLFVQGTRDDLAEIGLVREVCAGLGARADLHVVEGGDHSFRVLKRSGRDEAGVMQELGDTVAAFMRRTGA
jgi:predicted alpha/beta-hydrolase family hydrolase